MSTRFDAVLFDFGGVFTASPFHAFQQTARDLGASMEDVLRVIFGPYDEDTDHPWHRLERGEIDLGAARDEIMGLGRDAGYDIDPIAVLFRMGGSGGARPQLVSCVEGLRSNGLRTGLVTNNVAEFREHWRKMLPVDALFDVVIDSSEVGIRKPDPEIYRMSLRAVGDVAPDRAIFLDDFHGNVDAANRLGITGILVEDDPTSALAELDRLLHD